MRTIAGDRTRRPTRLDAVARSVSVVLPFMAQRLDRARLDAQVLLDSVAGRHPSPCRSERVGLARPPRLEAIDPVAFWLPASLARRYTVAGRDLGVLLEQLRGRRVAGPMPAELPA